MNLQESQPMADLLVLQWVGKSLRLSTGVFRRMPLPWTRYRLSCSIIFQISGISCMQISYSLLYISYFEYYHYIKYFISHVLFIKYNIQFHIPGSSRYVNVLPFCRFFGWKGTNFTHLEDPSVCIYIYTFHHGIDSHLRDRTSSSSTPWGLDATLCGQRLAVDSRATNYIKRLFNGGSPQMLVV